MTTDLYQCLQILM